MWSYDLRLESDFKALLLVFRQDEFGEKSFSKEQESLGKDKEVLIAKMENNFRRSSLERHSQYFFSPSDLEAPMKGKTWR